MSTIVSLAGCTTTWGLSKPVGGTNFTVPSCPGSVIFFEVDAAQLQSATLEFKIAQPTIDTQRILDMNDMFWAFVLALVSIWGVKQLLKLFSSDTDKD